MDNNLYEKVKKTLKDNEQQVQIIQMGISGAIATVIYSDFLRKFKNVQKPLPKVLMPELKAVQRVLKPGGMLMTFVSENLLELITQTQLYEKYKDCSTFKMFEGETKEVLKIAIDLHMIPNIATAVIELMRAKFMIGDPANQLFVESPDCELELFAGESFDTSMGEYIVRHAVIQMCLHTEDIPKKPCPVEENFGFQLPKSDDNRYILSISNVNALSVVHMDQYLIGLGRIWDLLSFVTGTNTMTEHSSDEAIDLTTSAFNQVTITELL